jgi:hypothetical protein
MIDVCRRPADRMQIIPVSLTCGNYDRLVQSTHLVADAQGRLVGFAHGRSTTLFDVLPEAANQDSETQMIARA